MAIDNGELIVTSNAKLNFSNNSAFYGGALILRNSVTYLDTDGIQFFNDRGSWGGALYVVNSTMYINSVTRLIMNGTAQTKGGAILI